MPDDLTAEEKLLLSTVHDLWSHSNGVWPVFAQVDKQLDELGIDAEMLLRSMVPRFVRLDGGLPASAGQQLLLSVRALAQLPSPPLITETFLAAVRYLALKDASHVPQPPGDVAPTATCEAFGEYLAASASIPRAQHVAAQLARAVGDFLRGEGHLWTSFSIDEDGSWQADVSRRVRRFRETVTLDEYLTRLDQILGEENGPGEVERGLVEGAEVVNVAESHTIDPRAVFVVHGRDLEAKHAVFGLLRDLDLRPLDWEELVAATGSAAPYVGDAVSIAFQLAQAVVVLLTPDDEARLLPVLHDPDEPAHETDLTGQPRPNVLFEAGMALASHPDRTILVEIGKVRPFSDVAGRHMVRLTGAASSVNAFATRLGTAGCPVKLTGSGWLNESRFKDLDAHGRGPNQKPSVDALTGNASLPLGAVLPHAPSTPAPPRLSATMLAHGRDHLIEISNRGGVAMRDVTLVLPPEARNWHLLTDVLPSWPISELPQREHRRFPASVSMGGPAVVEALLSAKTERGQGYEQLVTLSVYG